MSRWWATHDRFRRNNKARIESIHEFRDFERFREVSAKSSGDPLLYLAEIGFRRKCHDGNVGGRRDRAQVLENVVAVNVRQIDIQKDRGGQVFASHLDALRTCTGGEKFQVPTSRNQMFNQSDVCRTVFDVKDASHG